MFSCLRMSTALPDVDDPSGASFAFTSAIAFRRGLLKTSARHDRYALATPLAIPTARTADGATAVNVRMLSPPAETEVAACSSLPVPSDPLLFAAARS